MYKVLRASSLAILAGLSLLGCGGGNNAAAPNASTGNIPNLATRPSAAASQLKKVRLTGTIFNSLTGSPVERAEIQVQVVDTAAAAPASAAPGNPPASPNTRPGRNTPGNNSGPDAIPTPPPPGPVVPGAATPFPGPAPTAIPPIGTTPAPIPSAPIDGPPSDGGANPDASLPGGDAMVMTFAANGAAGASFQLAQNATPAPSGDEKPNLFKTDSNNKGKFFLNDVPDGKFTLTVTAPGYRTLTLTDANAAGLEIPMTPLESQRQIDVVGMVLSPTETPVGDAQVSPSFPLGEAIGVPSTSNSLGEFMLPDVPYGKHSIVAFTLDENQQIKQLGFLHDVPISDKTLKVKTPAFGTESAAPAPSPSGSTAEQLLDSVEKMLVDPSASPEASADPAASADPSVDPSADPTATPDPAVTADPAASADPAATPGPDDPVDPMSPAPTPAPETSSEPAPPPAPDWVAPEAGFEENEEAPAKKEEKGFNLLEAVTELVTGEKPVNESDEEVYPVIPLRSVLNDVALAGSVEVPEDYTPKTVEVYMTLPAAKDEIAQEVYLMTQPIKIETVSEKSEAKPEADAKPAAKASAKPAKAPKASAESGKSTGKFRLALPNLEKGHKYHLMLTAAKEGGELSYHHLYNLDESDEELAVSFMNAPTGIEIEGEDKNAVPPVPDFSWESVSGAEIYHLTLEAGTGAKQHVIWEAWTKETAVSYPLSTKAQRLRPQETYTVSVSALKGLGPASPTDKKQFALPSYRAIWTDLSRLTHAPFEVVE